MSIEEESERERKNIDRANTEHIKQRICDFLGRVDEWLEIHKTKVGYALIALLAIGVLLYI